MAGETVTIGLILFNAVDTVEAAFASALAQSHRAMEILLVDDASTDGTAALAKRLADTTPDVRFIARKTNSGAAACRNVIIAEARGDFIAFFDDDDVSAPTRIERQVFRLTEYEACAGTDLVICHSARLQHYPDGTSRIEPTMGAKTSEPVPHGLPVARRILAGTPLPNGYGSVATCSQMARTRAYRALGGFDTAFRRSQDTELCIRVAKSGGHFVGIGEPLVAQTMTRTADKDLERERRYWLALIDKHRDVFVSDSEYRMCRRWVDLRHDWLSGQRLSFWRGLGSLALTSPAFVARRLWLSLRNLGSNVAFARFHLGR